MTLCLRFFCAFCIVLFFVPDCRIYSQPLQITPHKKITITEPARQDKPVYAAISVNSQKDIYLTDMALNRILRIDSTGKLIREVGGFGWDNEQFDRPLDIWAENALDVLVADYNNHRIQRFDRNLNFVSTLENDASLEPRLQFGFPVAVAYSRFGEIFIAEQEHNRILKFDLNGNPVQSFGDYDWGAGSLEELVRIGISGKDAIFVADAMRKAVIKFDYYGNYLQEFPLDDFTSLDAIAVSSGYLFVLDAKTRRIIVLTTEGALLTDFVLDGGLPTKDQTSNGLDIAIAGKMLYILDGAAGVIQCFHLQNSSR